MRAVKHQALVIGHADADGHLIAEQVRRNLILTGVFDVDVLVDPERTRDHKSWLKLASFPEIDKADFVFFMDMMFAPGTFDIESSALVEFLSARPDKRFFLIDHHPLPERRLGRAANLRMAYRPDVFECAIGPRSGMMVVAALCQDQSREVADIKSALHVDLAVGVRRAAALGGSLPGKKLLALFEADRWDAILRLGKDDAKYHRLPRGRRPQGEPVSATLTEVEREADALLSRPQSRRATLQHGRAEMSYDADIGQERFVVDSGHRVRQARSARSRDLEAIVTLLEVAALSLTTEPGKTFTLEQLVAEAREIAGEEVSLRDIKIVLEKGKTSFLKHVGGKQYQLR